MANCYSYAFYKGNEEKGYTLVAFAPTAESRESIEGEREMKNIDWFDVFFVVLIGLTIALFFGCVIVPLLFCTGIDLWRWALA